MTKHLSTVINFLWIISAVAVFGTVFVVSPELKNETVTGKYFYFFYTQTVFVTLTTIVLWTHKAKLRLSLTDAALTVFVGWCCANFLWRESAFEIKIYLLLFLWMFFVCLRIMFQVLPSTKVLIPVLVICTTLAQSMLGLMQLYGFERSYHGLYKITGTFFNPGPYSGYVSLGVPLAMYYVLSLRKQAVSRIEDIKRLLFAQKATLLEKLIKVVKDKENIAPVVFAISVITGLSAVLVLPPAMSRSAWLGTIVGVGVVCVLEFGMLEKIRCFYRENKRKTVLFSIIVLLLGGVCFAGMYSMKRGSADGRVFLWKTASDIVVEHPLAGVGMGNFAGAYSQAQHDHFGEAIDQTQAQLADCPMFAFNEFLQISVEQGLIGLSLFLFMLWLAIRSSAKERIKTGVLGSITALLLFSLTSYPFSILPICMVFVVLIALSVDTADKGISLHRCLVAVGSTVMLLWCVCFLGKTSDLRSAYKDWKNLSMISSSGYYDTVDDYHKHYYYLSRYHGYMFSYGQALSKTGEYDRSTQILSLGAKVGSDPMFYNIIANNYYSLGDIQSAEKSYRRAYHTLPNRLYPLYLLTKMYHEAGMDDKARVTAQELFQKLPKVPSTAVKEMKEYARNVLEKADTLGAY